MHLTSLHVDATSRKAKIWLSEKLNRLFYKRIDRWLSYRVFVVVIKSRLYWSPIYMESDWTCNPTNQSSRSLGPVGSGWQSGKAQFKFIRREIWSVWRYKSYCKQIFGPHNLEAKKSLHIFSKLDVALISFSFLQTSYPTLCPTLWCVVIFSPTNPRLFQQICWIHLRAINIRAKTLSSKVCEFRPTKSHEIHFTLKFKPSHSKKGSIFLSLCEGKENVQTVE